jgi:tetratricopeptide (TPR) repeat protein
LSSVEAIYLFRHAAFRDVLYSLHLPSTRAGLHGAVFEVLEQEFAGRTESVANELAEHAHHAREGLSGDQAGRMAGAEFKYRVQSALRHAARAQWGEAIRSVRDALATGLGSPLERCELQMRMVEALGFLGRREELKAAALELHEMGKAAGEMKYEFQGLASAGLNLTNMGEHAAAEKLLGQALELADARGQPGTRAKARMDYAYLYNTMGGSTRQEELYLEALEVLGDIDDPIRLPLRGNLANLYGATGRSREAMELLRQIIVEVTSRAQIDVGGLQLLATAQVNLARQQLLLDDLAGAEQQFQQAVQTCTRTGKGSTTAFAEANLAEIYLRRGEFERAERAILHAMNGAREFGLPLYHAAYQCNFAQLQLLLGHESRAAETVEDSRAEFNAVGGDAFIHEYCGMIRLRIAASQAVSMRVAGRATSRLKAAPPPASWLPVMREIARQIQQSAATQGARASAPLHKAATDAAALLAEIESAVNERRPALVFRGHRPTEMLPSLRRTLRERLEPAEAQMLRQSHPALWEALGA